MAGRGRGRPPKEPEGVERKDTEDTVEKSTQQGASGEVKGTEEEGQEPTLMDIIAILQAQMGQQNVREAKQEQRFTALEQKLHSLQLEIETKKTGPVQSEEKEFESWQSKSLSTKAQMEHMAAPQTPLGQYQAHHEPKMERLNDNDDVEHFLVTFERIALACRWPKSDWVFHLIPLLSGKARGAYVNMDFETSLDYDQVKAAILSKYNISAEIYRQRFRSLEVHAGESPKELYARLKELYGKWVEPKGKTIHDIGEIIILEQYLRMLSPELQVWIRERDPKTAFKAAELADIFVAARQQGQAWSQEHWRRTWDNEPAPQRRHVSEGGGKPQHVDSQSMRAQKYSVKKPICYLCGVEGHTKPMCPNNTAKMTQMCYAPRFRAEVLPNAKCSIKVATVEVNGTVLRALLDSGSDQTLVHRDYIPLNMINVIETLPICCIHGDEKHYPTADIYLKLDDQTYLLNVAVVDSLPYPVVLGRDVPVLFDLLEREQNQNCCAALTRAQAKRCEETVDILSALPFYNEELETTPVRARKSKRKKGRKSFSKQSWMETKRRSQCCPLSLICLLISLKRKTLTPR